MVQLRELMEMMEAHDVTEVNLKNGDEQWRVRRGPQVAHVPAAPAPAAMPPAAATPTPAAAPAPAAPQQAGGDEAGSADEGLVDIKSPTVGTFYSSPSPDDPPFVKVGSQVSDDTVVCLVEAMKVFNEIPAECSGVIEKVLAKDGDAIDFGQTLFKVRPK